MVSFSMRDGVGPRIYSGCSRDVRDDRVGRRYGHDGDEGSGGCGTGGGASSAVNLYQLAGLFPDRLPADLVWRAVLRHG